MMSGFGNQTRITEEDEQDLVFDENEEGSIDQTTRTEKRLEPQSSSKKDDSKGNILRKDYGFQSVSEKVEHSGNSKPSIIKLIFLR